jgi:hypothetical protein
MFDPIKNFAISEVDPFNSSATEITVDSAAKFPDPDTDGNFNLVVWNATDYDSSAEDPNVEIIRVTGLDNNTFTITRAQEGTTATNHNTSGKTYKIARVLTEKDLEDLQDAVEEEFINAGDTPSTYTGQAEKILAVNSSEDAVEFKYITFLLPDDTPSSYTDQAGKVVQVNDTEDGLEFGEISDNFTGLTDTPSTYTDEGGKFLRVNDAEDAVEFTDTISTFSGMEDTPDTYVDQAGKYIKVSDNESGLEFTDESLASDPHDNDAHSETYVSVDTTSEASSSTPTPTGDSKENEYYLTALAANATFAEPSGTPANGNTLLIRIKDDGTARDLDWNAIYDGTMEDLPTTTTISKTMYLGFIYDSAKTKWSLISLVEEE